MTISSTTLASYLPDKFGPQGQAADEIIARVSKDLEQAEEMSRKAKTALFQMNSHYGAYRQHVSDEEKARFGRPWRASRLTAEHPEYRKWHTIEKHTALRANFRAAVDAFEYFCERLLVDAHKLEALMPALVDEAQQSVEGVTTNDCRKSNTMLCSIFAGRIQGTLQALAREFAPADHAVDDVKCSISALEHYYRANYNIDYMDNPFSKQLDVPFVVGVSAEPRFLKLEQTREKVLELMAAYKRQHRLYTAAKSKIFNEPQFTQRLAEAANLEAVYAIMQEIQTRKMEYAAAARARSEARLALTIFASWEARSVTDDAYKGYVEEEVLKNNIISVRCLLAEVSRLDLAEHERDYNDPPPLGDARDVLYSALKNIPLQFELPRHGYGIGLPNGMSRRKYRPVTQA